MIEANRGIKAGPAKGEGRSTKAFITFITNCPHPSGCLYSGYVHSSPRTPAR
jgi:hypothetical protein